MEKYKIAKIEKDAAILKWEIGQISTNDLEQIYKNINEKYGTNYKIIWSKIEYK